jgi:hypothetical protein
MDAQISADGSRVATDSLSDTLAVWDATSMPGPISEGGLRERACAINYVAIGPFSRDMRSGNVRLDNVDIQISNDISGRPWHPCDWRGLRSLEGWKQFLRFWAVKIGVPWDYACGERTAFGGIDKAAERNCLKQK